MKEVCVFSETQTTLKIKSNELVGDVLVSEYNLYKESVKEHTMTEEYLITETIGPRAPVVFSFYEDEGLLSRPPDPGRRAGTEVVTFFRSLDPMGLHQSL